MDGIDGHQAAGVSNSMPRAVQARQEFYNGSQSRIGKLALELLNALTTIRLKRLVPYPPSR